MAQTRRSMNQEPEEQPGRKKRKLRTRADRAQPSKVNKSVGVETEIKQEDEREVASGKSISVQGGHIIAPEAAALPGASQESANHATVNTPPTATNNPARRHMWKAFRSLQALDEKEHAVGCIMDKAYLGIRKSIDEKCKSSGEIVDLEAKERELQDLISLAMDIKERLYDEYCIFARKQSELEDAFKAAAKAKEEVVAKHNTAEKARRDGLKESLEEVRRLLLEEEQSL